MSRSTKILYVITKSNWGGAQKYVFDLATHMPDIEPVVALGGPRAGGAELTQRLNTAGVRTITIPRLGRDISIFDDVAVFFALLKLYREEQPDIIHLNSSKIGGLGALAGRIHNLIVGIERFLLLNSAICNYKSAIVFTVHGWYFNEPRSRLARLATLLLSWLTVILCHKVICVAEHDRRQMLRFPFTKKKLVTIYNGIAERPRLDKQAARESLRAYLKLKKPHATPPPIDGLWIGSVGELHQNKGFPFAVEAHARLVASGQDAYLTIIGDGEDRRLLEGLIRHHDHGAAHLFGAIPEAALYLTAFDIFILPSRKEGLPYVLLEAGAVGVPVLASRVGGIPEIVEHGESGHLVPPADSEALHEALVRLLGDKALRSAYGENLKRRVSKHFSLERMLRETLRAYEKQ
jgi:glycosyltransferase involved in cell wall biosynthesis